MKTKPTKFSPGLLSGITLSIDDNFVRFTGFSGGQAGSIPKKSIKAITVEPGNKFGDFSLKFIGDGTTLATLTTGIKWAEKCQLWLIEQLGL